MKLALAVAAAASLLLAGPARAAVCEYQPPEPRPSAAERRLEDQVHKRRSYGFPTNRRLVRRLIADPASLRRSPWPELDIVLTPREASYLRERFRLQDDRVTRRVDAYLRRHRRVLGVTSIEDDYPRRPYLQIRVTRRPAQHRAALRRRATFRVEVDRVRYSERELGRLQDSIDVEALRAEEIDFVTSSTDVDHVDLEVTTPRDDAAAVVRRMYGPAVRVKVLARTSTYTVCRSPDGYRLDPDGRTLHLTVIDSGSIPPRSVELVERDDAVEVGVISDHPYGPVTADAQHHRISVTLAAPLGARPVRSLTTRKPVRRG